MVQRFPVTTRNSPALKASGAAPNSTLAVTLEEARLLIAQKEAVAPTAPANTVAPALTGTATVGQTLSCTQGTWTGANIVYAYDWQRVDGPRRNYGNGANTYVLDNSDIGYAIRCVVIATNGAGAVRKASATNSAVVTA